MDLIKRTTGPQSEKAHNNNNYTKYPVLNMNKTTKIRHLKNHLFSNTFSRLIITIWEYYINTIRVGTLLLIFIMKGHHRTKSVIKQESEGKENYEKERREPGAFQRRRHM